IGERTSIWHGHAECNAVATPWKLSELCCGNLKAAVRVEKNHLTVVVNRWTIWVHRNFSRCNRIARLHEGTTVTKNHVALVGPTTPDQLARTTQRRLSYINQREAVEWRLCRGNYFGSLRR